MKNVIAIIRKELVGEVIEVLRHGGVQGATVIPATGFGEYNNNFSPESMEAYAQLEVMIDNARAAEVAQMIMDTAHSGTDGDGIVAISPLEEFYRIRDKGGLH